MKKINENHLIKISDEILEWKDAVHQGVDLLVKNGNCTPDFSIEIIKSVEEFGPYFILMPKLALAHAAPGDYIKENGLSLIVFKNKVKFSELEKHEVNLLFTLAAQDGKSHMDLLVKFVTLFQEDQDLVEKIIKLDSVKEIEKELKGLI